MLQLVRCYESTKSFQHPVGLTAQYPGGKTSALFESDADWIAPGGDGNYLSRPPKATGEKVIITDSDHLMGSSLDDPLWVYRSFFRGLNLLYMDRYYGADALNPEQVSPAPEVRAAMGTVRFIASLLDIGEAAPAPEVATTGYALRAVNWILVFAPDASVFDVDLRRMPGQLQLEWFDTVAGRVTSGGTYEGGKISHFSAPTAHGALLYVRAGIFERAIADRHREPSERNPAGQQAIRLPHGAHQIDVTARLGQPERELPQADRGIFHLHLRGIRGRFRRRSLLETCSPLSQQAADLENPLHGSKLKFAQQSSQARFGFI